MAATVLTVDDSASIRQMVGMTLKQAGYSVVEASDGQEGLDKAKTGTFQLVLTDQNMPRMDGLTLVRGLPAYKSVPILMLTTESGDAMKAQGHAAGGNGAASLDLSQFYEVFLKKRLSIWPKWKTCCSSSTRSRPVTTI